MAFCNAKTKTGGHCKTAAMPNGKCRLHGGATPTGIASASFKHGKHSKDAHLFHLPKRMTREYNIGTDDGNMLSVDADIALLFARQCDVLGRVDTGESGEMWRSLLASIKEVQRCRKLLDKAMRLEDWQGMHEAGRDLSDALDGMELLAQGGVSDYAAWREVKDVTEQIRKLRETETKRRIAQQEMMTRQDAQLMLGKVLLALRSHIHDRDTLVNVSAELRRLVDIAACG